MNALSKAKSKLSSLLLKTFNREAFEADFLRSLPAAFRPASEWLYYRNIRSDEKQTASFIEQFRAQIVASDKKLHTFTSPKSGTFTKNSSGRAAPGEFVASEAAEVAATGVSEGGGILLKRIVEGAGWQRVLELGANTGFSGCYFLSCPQLDELVTIEGSAELCEIARSNMGRMSKKFTVLNALFDDALDELREGGERFDCVFIDGQHEKEATLHFAERARPLLNPGGAILFDDIYWSDGMNAAWKAICYSRDYATTVDLRWKGVAIARVGDEDKQHFDICEYIGRPRTFRGDH